MYEVKMDSQHSIRAVTVAVGGGRETGASVDVDNEYPVDDAPWIARDELAGFLGVACQPCLAEFMDGEDGEVHTLTLAA